MKKTIIFVLLWTAAAICSLNASEKKGVVIMLDGLRSDATLSASVPNLNAIRFGTWADGYKGTWSLEAHTNLDSPPSSATNHVAIATGVTATKNNCYNNGQIPQTKWAEYPSFMSRIRAVQPGIKSVWLYNWGEDADIVTDATYVGPPQSDNSIFQDAAAFLNGTFPTKEGIQDTKWTEGDDPDLLMLYIDGIDGNGHGHGFTVNSPEYMACLENFDKQIGNLLDTIKARPHFADEDWLIVVVSDHGGIGTGHGVVGSQNCYTIPLYISSKDVESGRMKGEPKNCDVAAYAMQHFTGSIPAEFDGKIEPTFGAEQAALTDGLIAYFPFEGDANPARGDFAGKDGFLPHDYIVDGKIGKALSLRDSNPMTFGKPEALQFGKDRDFTFAFWFRAEEPQIGDAPILSNKDWHDCFQSGIVLTANVLSEEGTKLEFNLGDSVHHHDLNPLAYEPDGKWYFAAITADRDGNAVLYLGNPDGKLAFISENLGDFGDIDNMDWYLAQDGTGKNAHAFSGDMDELMIWERALNNDEVMSLFKRGFEGKSILK